MRKRIALSALGLTGMAFLGTAFAGLPQDPAHMSLGLKVAIIASCVAFMLAVVACVFVAWPKKQESREGLGSATEDLGSERR